MSSFHTDQPATRARRQRAMGAYYTPGDASDWMAQWLLSDGIHTVLEPSCGDGAFVTALSRMAGASGADLSIHAVEVDPDALDRMVAPTGVHKVNADFHLVDPFPVDAVIGNPPFVRLRHLPSDEARGIARRAASTAIGGGGVDPAGSIWMTIVLHATTFLRPGGRLAVVLPADALYVKYAQPFWKFMSDRFGTLRVIRCRERIFPQILQDVVLLLADRSGSSTDVIDSELYRTRFDLTEEQRAERTVIPVSDVLNGSRPFVKALLGERFGAFLTSFEEQTVPANTYAKFNVGYVDANKRFFHPSVETEREFDLPVTSLHAAAKSGRSMAGSGYATSTLPAASTHKLWLARPEMLTAGELAYIRFGEDEGAHTGFKARSRQPWFRVPDVRVPDLLMPVFGELPKMMLNDAGLVASNSLMLGFWRRQVDEASFLLSWYSSPTRLGIELSVHSLGGGVLVVVPSEADAVRMPRVPDVSPSKALLGALDEALRAKDLMRAYQVGDAYLQQAGWHERDLATAQEMANELLAWRVR